MLRQETLLISKPVSCDKCPTIIGWWNEGEYYMEKSDEYNLVGCESLCNICVGENEWFQRQPYYEKWLEYMEKFF